MQEKTKLILLSGFLGSGKTTLLKHVMSLDADMSDTVILMNEFGEIGIDGMLLKNIGTDVVELTSGCICCSMSDDLIETLELILERFGPRYIIIEATGVADPESVVNVMKNSDVAEKVEIYKIITVMDSECWKVRDVFGTLFYRQLKQADTIILNKIDLLEKDEIPRFLEEIHQTIPNAQVIPAVDCKILPEMMWLRPVRRHIEQNMYITGGGQFDCCEQGDCRHHGHETGTDQRPAETYADTDFVTFSFSESLPLDETAFRRFVEEMPWELFRMKGTVNLGDRTVLINAVGGKTEWAPWQEMSETRLAFVGWGINAAEFFAKLKACVSILSAKI